MSDHDAELAYLRETPVEELLGNHFFVVMQVAAYRLSLTPPAADDARLLIDVLGGILNAGEGRLGENESLYRTALSELQQAYVRSISTQG